MLINATLLQVLIVLCLVVVGFDMLARRVPNSLLVAVALICLIMLAAMDLQAGLSTWPHNLTSHLLGAAVGLVVLLPFWMIGWMGAGDVKLFSLLGLIVGLQALLPIWCFASIIAGIHVIAILITRARPEFVAAQAWLGKRLWYQRFLQLRQGRHGIPYAAYLSIGALLTMHYSM